MTTGPAQQPIFSRKAGSGPFRFSMLGKEFEQDIDFCIPVFDLIEEDGLNEAFDQADPNISVDLVWEESGLID